MRLYKTTLVVLSDFDTSNLDIPEIAERVDYGFAVLMSCECSEENITDPDLTNLFVLGDVRWEDR